MAGGIHGKALVTMASSGALNIALRQAGSLGNSVKPPKNTKTHTITTPLSVPNRPPSTVSNHPKPTVLNIWESAIDNKAVMSNVAKNKIRKAAKYCSVSVGIALGNKGANYKFWPQKTPIPNPPKTTPHAPCLASG